MSKATGLAMVLMWAAAGSVQAADCLGGDMRGSTGPNGPPDENIQCQVMGRIFCAVSDFRNAGVESEVAVDRTADWLKHLGQTGSHLTGGDFRPSVRFAAGYVYSHDQMLPFTAYNYAAWTCGLNQRITDSAAQQKVANRWEDAAQGCVRESPGEGDGARNQKLKDCLDAAMNGLVQEEGLKAQKK